MGQILKYIEENNEGRFHCYSTRKFSLDDHNTDTISSENSDQDTTPNDTTGKFAETNTKRTDKALISNSLIISTPPLFQILFRRFEAHL